MLNRSSRYLLTIALLAVCACLAQSNAAQRKREDKARPRKFGESLKRLRWDSPKNAAVEASQKKTAAPKAQADETAIRIETLLVVFDVSVNDPATGRWVSGLTKDDFTVIEDGNEQRIATVSRGDEASLPRSIVLIIDSSSSQRAYLEASLTAAKELVNRLAPADEMAIVTDDVDLLTDFTSDKARLARTLDSLLKRARMMEGPSRSLQFTALFAALRELVSSDGKRPIIVFQTDGDEAPTLRDQDADGAWRDAYDHRYGGVRQFGLADITRAAERSRATIYTVVPSERLVGLARQEVMKLGGAMLDKTREVSSKKKMPAYQPTEKLRELFIDRLVKGQESAVHIAELSGGWAAFLEKPDDASNIYSAILADMNRRYVIGYYPTNVERDGGLRRVRIEVRGHPEYIVRGRTSYYSPAKD